MAERFGTTEQTVLKWKCSDPLHDDGHNPHRLQTTLTPAEEAVAVDAAFEARMARQYIPDATHGVEVQEEYGMGS